MRYVTIFPFPSGDARLRGEATRLLAKSFPQAYAKCAAEEIDECLAQGNIAFAACEGDTLLGFVGARPTYGAFCYELHPLAVFPSFQKKGIGRALVSALEAALDARGAGIVYLGCDDKFGEMSLSQGDLFADTFTKIENIQNFGGHPYSFYQKLGYRIVGVLPDANGAGKPDIFMAKRIVRNNKEDAE